ncbi:cyanophycinase [Cytobacillus sp. BC1816]|uniref:cyanophycinase n=1 Tax=Cytobacillus sp. BC1816 TaxID=3440154 RepID=UPI003F511858
MKKWIVFTLLLLLFGSTGTSEIHAKKNSEDIKGNLVIAGGALGSTNRDVYQKFIDLAGGTEQAKIGIIPAASGSLKSSYAFKKDLLSYGVMESSVEILPVSSHDFSGTEEDESSWKKNSESRELAEKIEGMTGIWFVGGDQLKITDALLKKNGKNSKTLDAIWKIYRDGAVLGGTSAGAAIMSDVMITGGDSLGGFNQEFTNKERSNSSGEYAPVYIEKGLGFFQWGIVDQHFDERARLGRLAATAIKSKPRDLAYGVDENTAMIVNNQMQTIEVTGRSGVAVLDVTAAKRIGKRIKNVDISYMSAGDKLHAKTREFTFKNDKAETKGYEYYNFKPLPATGVLSSYGSLKHYLSYSLVDNASTNKAESYLYNSAGEGFKLIFEKGEDTNGYWGYEDGQKDSYSLLHVKMSVEPVTVSFEKSPELFKKSYQSSSFTAEEEGVEAVNKGSLVIAGGALGSSNQEVYEAFISRAGEKPKIGIVPAASSSLKSSYAFKSDLEHYGVPADNIDILKIASLDFKGTPEDESLWKNNKNDPELADQIKNYDAIWFVGGDQTNISAALLNGDGSRSLVLQSIWDIYHDGAVLGGTSAGAAIMSDVMLAGGGSYDTLASGFTETYDSMTQQEGGPGYLEKGLGFFPHGIIDQHFDKKARLGRLIATAAAHGKQDEFSYGIDEDTALVLDNDTGKITAVGRGGVSVIDLSQAEKQKDTPSLYKNIRLSWMKSGDVLDLETKEFTIREGKLSTKDYEYYDFEAAPHSGVLSPHGSLGNFISYSLADNSAEDEVKSYSFSEGKGFELTFRKGSQTKGFWGYKDGSKDDYSFVGVELNIEPVTVKIR